MYKKAAIFAVALAGQAYVEAVSIQKRDGAHGHGHGHAAAAAPAPDSSYGSPAASYGAPAAASSYGAPAAAASSYGAPAASYGAPAGGYGAPADSYGAPADGYGAPSSGYGAPSTGYGAPATGVGYGAEDAEVAGAGPGLLPIIIGILALVGLSLLFPTFVSLSSVRRKRAADEEGVNPMADLANRVNDIYGAVVESEECMEKIACELGGMVKDLNVDRMTGLIAPFVPNKYSGFYKQFAFGKNCDKIKCGKML